MEAMLNFVPAPVAIVLMLAGFIALADRKWNTIGK